MRALMATAPLLLSILAGCGPKANGGSPAKTAAAELWSVEIVDASGAPTVSTLICADAPLQASFERAVPEVNGRRCEPIGEVIQRGPLYAGRCRADGRVFAFRTVSDQEQDGSFIVDTMIRERPPSRMVLAQSRLYWRTGACPAGWRAGDTAPPGARQVRNVLSGETRPLQAAAPAFPGG